MRNRKLIKRNLIFLMYGRLLLKENNLLFEKLLNSQPWVEDSHKKQEVLEWFNQFESNKERVFQTIGSHLKKNWQVDRLPPLEKAIIASTVHWITTAEQSSNNSLFLLVNQSISFSKKYLEQEKCSYINKVLDLVVKEHLLSQKV